MGKKKQKKQSSFKFTLFRYLLGLLLILLSGLLLWQIFKLSVLPPILFIPIFLGLIIIDFLLLYVLLIKRARTGLRVTCSVLAVALSLVCGYGSFVLYKGTNALNLLTAGDDGMTKYDVSVLVTDNSKIESVKDLNNKTIGFSLLADINGVGACYQEMLNEGINLKTDEYGSFTELADALLDDDVDAIIIPNSYIPSITEESGYQGFSNETRSVFTYSYISSTKVESKPIADVTENPFIIMISGSDSRVGLGETDRSDVNMLVVINPKTQVVLMVGIPRDSYVPVICSDDYACQYGEYDKLTHSGMFTYNTTKRTIENFLDVDINYTFRVNFTALVDLVDALGGIDVYVEPGYAVDYFWTNDYFGTDYGVVEGVNHLNGEAALCYAREREAYLEGDFQRIRNQQEVLQQIINKALSFTGLASYTSLLDVVANQFWTDMTSDEILSLLRYQISQSPDWTFLSYFLNGESTSRYCAESYGYASVIVLDKNSVQFTHDIIEDVMNGESGTSIENAINSYDLPYDFTEDYNIPGVYTVGKGTNPHESGAYDTGYYDYGYDYGYGGGYDYSAGYDSSYDSGLSGSGSYEDSYYEPSGSDGSLDSYPDQPIYGVVNPEPDSSGSYSDDTME